MLKRLFIFIICFATVAFTGCWDRRELNTIGIVYGVAIDKDMDKNEYIITAQVIRPSQLNSKGSLKSPVELVTSRGRTISDAIKSITLFFDKKLFFNHNKFIVISKDVAKEGILSIIDFFFRDRELRKSIWVIISKEEKASDILGVIHGISDIQAAYVDEIVDLKDANGKMSNIKLIELSQRLYSEGIEPIASVAQIKKFPLYPIEIKEEIENKGLNFYGTAVFKGDKLVGYLDDIETMGLNWITNKMRNCVIVIPGLVDNNKKISIQINNAKTEIKPELIDSNYLLNIKVKASGNIGETEECIDFTNDENFIKLQNEVNKVVKEQIEKVINKQQKQFESDIFGFGSALNKKYPHEWLKIKDNWDKIFSNVKYNIEVEIKILNSGLTMKSEEIEK
ncbi:Ger(x)C family spore germination protein [Caloramator sp. E03]|uniref:Ger(x)C family spore germination protein n=1 Tax=Caloramator sp. E03 TaxID=2576307 RepID=UPI0011106E27|nr:Ger(x)C family spore germination protein [Caloramator sp. E03]QCX34302.1 Ger(x)C family spore germination protein [Caloramator sp. E03]